MTETETVPEKEKDDKETQEEQKETDGEFGDTGAGPEISDPLEQKE